MAITWTNDYDGQAWEGQSFQWRAAKGTPASSDYTTTGYTITPNLFGLLEIRSFVVAGVDSASSSTNFTTAVVWQYNHATGKLQAFWSAAESSSAGALAEVTASTDLSAYTVRVLVAGF